LIRDPWLVRGSTAIIGISSWIIGLGKEFVERFLFGSYFAMSRPEKVNSNEILFRSTRQEL